MPTNGLGTLCVLIVDDNAHMRALLRSLLESAGIRQIAEAEDGAGALARLKEREIDLVLTDMVMEPMDGIVFTRTVRTDAGSPNPFVPIIMITGHTERQRVVEARDAGVTEFIAKPVNTQGLVSHITAVIAHPRPFVRGGGYFGPDRRRHKAENYTGPWRRQDDFGEVDVR